MKANASINYITELSPADLNQLLYVGDDAPEPEQANKSTDGWPSDEFFGSCAAKGNPGPLYGYEVCACTGDTMCFMNNTGEWTPGCEIGAVLGELDEARPWVNYTDWYFLWNCSSCFCLTVEPAPTPAVPTPAVPTPAPAPPAGSNTIWYIGGAVAALLLIGVVCSMTQSSGGADAEEGAELPTNEA